MSSGDAQNTESVTSVEGRNRLAFQLILAFFEEIDQPFPCFAILSDPLRNPREPHLSEDGLEQRLGHNVDHQLPSLERHSDELFLISD
jgi:hypothetical protein